MEIKNKYIYGMILFVSSALIMIIEIIGAKFLTPFLGGNHIVWITQILITLICLAIGALISNKFFEDKKIGLSLIFSGLLLGTTSTYIFDIIHYLSDYSLIINSIILSIVLYSFPLISLAMIYPIVAKKMNELNIKLGTISFIGTIGSAFGTIITYFIILKLSNYSILLLTAIILILLGNYIGKLLNFRLTLISLIFLLLVLIVQTQNNDTTIIEYQNTHFGEIIVKKENENIILYNDQLAQNGYDQNKESIFLFNHVLTNFPMMLNNNIKDVLMLGLGMGITARDFENKGINVSAIEINPEMIKMSKKYLGLKKTNIIEGDSRYEIDKINKKFDVIVHDCFLVDNIPKYLLTQQFFKKISNKLNKNGILVMNSFGKVSPNDYVTDATFNTLKTVFTNVKMYSLNEYNVYFIASNDYLIFNDYRNTIINNEMREKFNRLLKSEIASNKKTIIIDDNYNNIEHLSDNLRENYRKQMLKI